MKNDEDDYEIDENNEISEKFSLFRYFRLFRNPKEQPKISASIGKKTRLTRLTFSVIDTVARWMPSLIAIQGNNPQKRLTAKLRGPLLAPKRALKIPEKIR